MHKLPFQEIAAVGIGQIVDGLDIGLGLNRSAVWALRSASPG